MGSRKGIVLILRQQLRSTRIRVERTCLIVRSIIVQALEKLGPRQLRLHIKINLKLVFRIGRKNGLLHTHGSIAGIRIRAIARFNTGIILTNNLPFVLLARRHAGCCAVMFCVNSGHVGLRRRSVGRQGRDGNRHASIRIGIGGLVGINTRIRICASVFCGFNGREAIRFGAFSF